MTIDDNVKFDYAELWPIVGLFKCYYNYKSKDKEYIGLGGMGRKYFDDYKSELIRCNDLGRTIRDDNKFFPLPTDVYVFITYQAIVSAPIIMGIMEKF